MSAERSSRPRLRSLKPRISTLGSVLPAAPATTTPGSWRDGKRAGRSRFYDTRAWRDRIRPAKLRRNPLCEDCLEQQLTEAATEVDHVDGDSANNLPENLRSLCKTCHSKKTARHDGSFGKPVDRK